MEGKRYQLIVLLFTLVVYFNASAQNWRKAIVYQAFVTGNMDDWLYEIRKLESLSVLDDDQKLELLNYYYGYTAWLISDENKNKAEEYIDKANELINFLLEEQIAIATTLAYQGAFLGFEIGINGYKAILLGPKSLMTIEKSLQIEPDNIHGIIERANAYYFSPGMFGGSKIQAIQYYKKAMQYFESTNTTVYNWLYLNSLTQLALAYQKTDQNENAGYIYKKILNTEPNFKWVKEDLYPEFLKAY